MLPAELQRRFPKLTDSSFSIQSPEDPRYNCLAFALGDERQWWEHGAKLCYWPPGFTEGETLDSWIRVFELHGYRKTANRDVEPVTEKVAIYADLDFMATQVAKQQPNGLWKSKLGRGHDIEHASLEALEGDQMDEYGLVAQVLQRKGQ